MTIIFPEMKWIETVYDIDQCVAWVDHAQQLQAKVWTLTICYIRVLK